MAFISHRGRFEAFAFPLTSASFIVVAILRDSHSDQLFTRHEFVIFRLTSQRE